MEKGSMLRAEQSALIQQANQQLLEIRQEEVNYLIKIFSAFGTQGALFAGFTVQALTNVDALDSESPYWWKDVYWVASALVMVFSLHAVLTSTFVDIYGPGMVLRGQAGSVVKAVQGMVKETNPIFLSFILSLLAFQCSALGICFVLMSAHAAWACAGIFALGLYYWYKACFRVYERFRLDEVHVWSRDSVDLVSRRALYESQSFNSADRSGIMTKDLVAAIKYQHDKEEKEAMEQERNNKEQRRGGNFFYKIVNRNQDSSDDSSSEESNGEMEEDVDDLFMEGYLTKRNQRTGIFKPLYSRKYFVLHTTFLYYYDSREHFESAPKKSIKNRPISIAGYRVEAFEGDKGILQINLTPQDPDDGRRTWEFRVDTLSELENWVQAFHLACSQPPEVSRNMKQPSNNINDITTV